MFYYNFEAYTRNVRNKLDNEKNYVEYNNRMYIHLISNCLIIRNNNMVKIRIYLR